jgi:hypothetical protein
VIRHSKNPAAKCRRIRPPSLESWLLPFWQTRRPAVCPVFASMRRNCPKIIPSRYHLHALMSSQAAFDCRLRHGMGSTFLLHAEPRVRDILSIVAVASNARSVHHGSGRNRHRSFSWVSRYHLVVRTLVQQLFLQRYPLFSRNAQPSRMCLFLLLTFENVFGH